MKNIDFCIDDFTENNYIKLLEIAKENNEFKTYEETIKEGSGIVWRHDIDYSVNRAYALALIEKEIGVKSYFFVHLHSAFYNVMEPKIAELLREVSNAGAYIGLHFDPSFWKLNINEKTKLETQIIFEKQLLEKIIDAPVGYMSFHNPDVGGKWYEIPEDRLGGLVNVYGNAISSSFEYCSDSNGYWRYKRLEDVLRQSSGKRLHVLTHPAWWQKEIMYPYDRIKRCVEGRADNVLKTYVDALDRDGRINAKGKA